MQRLITMLGAALVAGITTGGFVMANTLSDLRWEKRTVILFGSDEGRVEQQAAEFRRDEDGMSDRDMLVFSVIGDELHSVYGKVPSGETPDALRERFMVSAAEPYTAVLIGKDGTEKWRGSTPVFHTEIDGIIDAMPMRRSGD